MKENRRGSQMQTLTTQLHSLPW